MNLQKCVIICGVITCFTPLIFAQKAVLCYIAAWSVGRPDLGKFSVLDADTDHCTHIVYAFMGLDESTNEIKTIEPYIDLDVQGLGQNQLIKLKQLKFTNPNVKLLVSIGGWNEAGKKFSDMARSIDKRQTFIESVTKFLSKYELDGLDFCWQFPGQRGGRPEDKENTVILFQELKQAFEPQGWILTVHIIGKRYVMDSYDIKAVSDTVDYINLAAVEYNGPWERKTGVMAPLSSKNELNVEFSVDYILKKGASRSKLLLGLPTYGHAYLLPEPPSNQFIGLFSNETFSSQWTNEFGITGYHETCYNMKNSAGWKEIWDDDSQTPLAYNEKKFISFDNEKSLILKAGLVDSRLLGGVMIWSLDMDDFQGLCNGTPYPLVTAVANHINSENHIIPSESTTDLNKDKLGSTSTEKPIIDDINDENLNFIINSTTDNMVIDELTEEKFSSTAKPTTEEFSSPAKPTTEEFSSSAKPTTEEFSSSAKPTTEVFSSSAKPTTVDLNEENLRNTSETYIPINNEPSYQNENNSDIDDPYISWSYSWQNVINEFFSSVIRFFYSIYRAFFAF